MNRIEHSDQFHNVVADRKVESSEERMAFDHAAVASQAIKVVNSIRMDPFVKKVMTLRILGPMVTGNERTHISIALELGASVDDVIAAEKYGTQVVENLLHKCSTQDFVEKFNRERAVENAVNEMGKSAAEDRSDAGNP